MPEAVFIVDIRQRAYRIEAEANKLGIRSFAMNDTNTNPVTWYSYPIPGNDDASKSIAYVVDVNCQKLQLLKD